MSKLDEVSNFLKQHLVGASEVVEKYGALTFSRLPSSTNVRHGNNFMMLDVASMGSGVRLEFLTDASRLSLELAFEQFVFPGAPAKEVKIVAEVNGKEYVVACDAVRVFSLDSISDKPELTFENIDVALGDAGTSKKVLIWLPQHSFTYFRGIELDSSVSAAISESPTWVHYGSSISHCSEADLPTGVWPVIASKKMNLNLVNLGLGGNALLDPFMVEVILRHKPDLVSLKVGINSVNGAHHTIRTFIPAVYGFLDALRIAMPNLKILLISPIFCPPHEDGFGPTLFDLENFKATANSSPAPELFPSNLNLTRVRSALRNIFEDLSKTDKNIFYFDGLDLINESEGKYLFDDLHPNTDGYKLMGERFAMHPTVAKWQNQQ